VPQLPRHDALPDRAAHRQAGAATAPEPLGAICVAGRNCRVLDRPLGGRHSRRAAPHQPRLDVYERRPAALRAGLGALVAPRRGRSRAAALRGFFAVFSAPLFGGRPAAPALALPVSEAYHDETLPAVRNFTPWVAVAIVLLAIAYVPPIYSAVTGPPQVAPAYEPSSPLPVRWVNASVCARYSCLCRGRRQSLRRRWCWRCSPPRWPAPPSSYRPTQT